ncbi:hypothetical protein [Duganella sp. LjRoot269]|uniref:hypothetical protein n=1 Tax=Duganella sp. LjRoot269 TaxID=3342305 RepID=UPI003F5019B8
MNELEHEFFLNLFATSLTTATTTVNYEQDTDLNTARLPAAAGAAPGRRLHPLPHKVDGGRRAIASGAPRYRHWPAPRPGTHQLLAHLLRQLGAGRRLLQLQHQVDGGRRARAAGAPRYRRWPAPRPGAHQLLAGRRRRRAHAGT